MAKKVSRPVLKNGSSIGSASDYIDNRILDALESFSGGGPAPDLSAYAKKIDVQNDLEKKAGVAEVAAKADAVYVDAELAKKANTSDVSAKADKTYVDTQLSSKANTSALSAKADTTTMNTELAKKVDKTTKLVKDITLNGKVFTVTYTDNTTATLTLA